MAAESKTNDLLERMLEPFGRAFSPESAHAVLEMRADEALQARIDELADKANEGLLSLNERVEYETYARFIAVLGVLQTKARHYLQQPRAA